jgi:hypothetical protein
VEDLRGPGKFLDRIQARQLAEYRARMEGTEVDYSGCYDDDGNAMINPPVASFILEETKDKK